MASNSTVGSRVSEAFVSNASAGADGRAASEGERAHGPSLTHERDGGALAILGLAFGGDGPKARKRFSSQR